LHTDKEKDEEIIMKLIIICLIVVAAATTIGMGDTDVFTNMGEYHITDYPFNEGAQTTTDNTIFTSSIHVDQESSSIQLTETSKDFTGGLNYVPPENNFNEWNDFSLSSMGEDFSFRENDINKLWNATSHLNMTSGRFE